MAFDPSPADAIWRRLEAASTAGVQASATGTPAPTPPARPRPWARRRWRVLDILGTLTWIYVLLEILVVDVDRAVLGAVAPAALPLLDYRLVVYLAFAALAAMFLRRWWLYLAYVVGFPLVVLFWKVPFFLFRHRSWPFFLGLLQTLSTVLGDLRYNTITKSLAIIAGVLIVFTDSAPLILPSAVYVACLLIWSLIRRTRRMIASPSFVEVQRKTIRRLMSSAALVSLTTLKDEYRTGDVEPYDTTQAANVSMTISMGIGAAKGLYLWAYQLDRYRRRFSPSLVFNLFSYAWVFFASLGGLTLLNTALMKLDPAQYALEGPRSLIAVLMYSFSTFALGQAGGVHPTGDGSLLLQIVGGVTGLLILASLGTTLLVTYVRERDDTATQALIDDLKSEAKKQELRFQSEYSVTVDEALDRMNRFGLVTAGLLSSFLKTLPRGYPDE
jgi:hypothetical protein